MAAVAPMDLVTRPDPTAIPLECILCPKKPKFSDVSHLLTHISSKSHLSHRFKTELMGHANREYQLLLQRYEDWYTRYNIRALLAERMAAKDRKTGRRGRSSNNSDSKSLAAPTPNTQVKTEPGGFATTPTISSWAIGAHQVQGAGPDYFSTPGYQTPVMRRSGVAYSIPDTPVRPAGVKYERFPSETETTTGSAITSELPSEITEELEDNNDESCKLHGVKYPGMGMFDSANEVQKRKRNQRKDASVLRNMEQTSAGILPNESIWNEIGDLQRIRDIYATPSIDGSPEPKSANLTSNRKKKRTRHARAPAVADPKPRQTRSSARIAKNKLASAKTNDLNDSSIDNDGERGTKAETSQRAQPSGYAQAASHSHRAVDSYDVFGGLPPRTSHLGSPFRQHGFGDRNRQPLQAMSSNVAMISPVPPPKPVKNVSLPYLPARDSGPPPFASQLSVPGNHYSQTPNNIGSDFNNPLCARSSMAGGYSHNYGYPYGTDTRYPTHAFQPVNNSGQNLGAMPINYPFMPVFQHDPTQEPRQSQYDI